MSEVVYVSHVRIERVHGFYAKKSPVYRSIRGAIEVTSTYELKAE